MKESLTVPIPLIVSDSESSLNPAYWRKLAAGILAFLPVAEDRSPRLLCFRGCISGRRLKPKKASQCLQIAP